MGRHIASAFGNIILTLIDFVLTL